MEVSKTHAEIPKNNLLNELYKHFFYTYISNYSIYAYNTNDYYQECNSDKFEELIRREKKKKYPTEYKNWLNGIFHKTMVTKLLLYYHHLGQKAILI